MKVLTTINWELTKLFEFQKANQAIKIIFNIEEFETSYGPDLVKFNFITNLFKPLIKTKCQLLINVHDVYEYREYSKTKFKSYLLRYNIFLNGKISYELDDYFIYSNAPVHGYNLHSKKNNPNTYSSSRYIQEDIFIGMWNNGEGNVRNNDPKLGYHLPVHRPGKESNKNSLCFNCQYYNHRNNDHKAHIYCAVHPNHNHYRVNDCVDYKTVKQ
jgi:hypothetical protein